MQQPLALDPGLSNGRETPAPVFLPGAELRLAGHFYAPPEADRLFERLLAEVDWRQDHLRIAGRRIPVPRLQAWYGEDDANYGYSGITLTPRPWLPLLDEIRGDVSRSTGVPFNSVLVNLYRHGQDSVDWHADNEFALGPAPVIASLSLGEPRTFQLRRRGAPRGEKAFRISLTHGSLLVMGAGMQQDWQHRIPKEPAVNAARINLTFRHIRPDLRQTARGGR